MTGYCHRTHRFRTLYLLYDHLTNALQDVPSHDKQCDYCTTPLSIDKAVKKFPCDHTVHRSCAVSIILSALSDSDHEGVAASKVSCPLCLALLFPALQREPKARASAKREATPDTLDKYCVTQALSIQRCDSISKKTGRSDVLVVPFRGKCQQEKQKSSNSHLALFGTSIETSKQPNIHHSQNQHNQGQIFNGKHQGTLNGAPAESLMQSLNIGGLSMSKSSCNHP